MYKNTLIQYDGKDPIYTVYNLNKHKNLICKYYLHLALQGQIFLSFLSIKRVWSTVH